MTMTDLASRDHKTIPAAHFDTLYAGKPDPWDYQTSLFEAGKRAKTLEALGGRGFQKGMELGCSIGVLTEALSHHCESIVGVDGSETACGLARNRLANQPNANVLQARFPEDLQKLEALGSLDLIVLSEVLYFFSQADMRALAGYVCASLMRDGLVVVVNFDGDTQAGYSGVEASQLFAKFTAHCLQQVTHEVCPGFEVASYTRRRITQI
jgi:predicted TPR repeat methyltransferase